MITSRTTNALISLITLLVASATAAQCDSDWIETPGFGYAGVHGNVIASVMWDPDGLGPEPELFVIGGMFDAVDDTPAAQVAAWDGESWSNLGGGVTEGHIFERVSALAVYNGQLIVGGTFGKAGDVPVNGIAAWDSAEWHPLGQGIYGGFPEPEVRALTVHKGLLIAGGAFTDAGNGPADFIAAWDGTDWSPLGAGTNFEVTSLGSFGEDLFVGGHFTSAGNGVLQTSHLARWDGTNWHSAGGSANAVVFALNTHDGNLYAGGNFTSIGGAAVSKIARWNGSGWDPLGSGASGSVTALTTFEDELHIGGQFTSAGGTSANNAARWDGVNWHALGQGTNNTIWTLSPSGTQLFAGGTFRTAEGQTAQAIAAWNSETWSSFGGRPLNIEARGLEVFEGSLIVSGYAGPDRSSTVVGWDGLDWTPLGGDFNELVWDTGIHNDDLYALGWFTTADSGAAGGVARWTGSQWEDVGAALTGGYVTSALTLGTYNGDLIIGGDFSSAGGVAANHIARWDGSQWHPLGDGIGDEYSFVWELLEYQGDLVAIGEYAIAGGAPVNGVARWDGTDWHPLGSGLTGGILPGAECAVIFDGDLIVGGTFTHAGGTPAMNIARWDGSQWHPIGTGFSEHGVKALGVYNGRLYAGGQFVFNDMSNSRIAVWNGTLWETVGGGVNGGVSDFAPLETELIITGGFSTAGDTVAPGLARWSDTNTPWFAQQPVDAEACLEETLQFEAAIALGYESATLRWRRNGEPLTDGPTGYGSTISGSGTGSLTITDVHASDDAIYVCLAESACGSASSNEAHLTLCVADYNCDQSVNTLDVLAFLNAWNAGDTHADINGDGEVNTIDVLAFLNGWNAGC